MKYRVLQASDGEFYPQQYQDRVDEDQCIDWMTIGTPTHNFATGGCPATYYTTLEEAIKMIDECKEYRRKEVERKLKYPIIHDVP
jgi:hypothetical protein